MHPDHHHKRLLTEAEAMPADVVSHLAHSAIDTYEQLTRQGHPAGEALWPTVEDPELIERAAGRVTASFQATADTRDWIVPTKRVHQLASDVIGLYLEGERYDYDREHAHSAAVVECMEGEAARVDVWPSPPEFEAHAARASGMRVERARGGGER
jgi:hypothetical protein